MEASDIMRIESIPPSKPVVAPQSYGIGRGSLLTALVLACVAYYYTKGDQMGFCRLEGRVSRMFNINDHYASKDYFNLDVAHYYGHLTQSIATRVGPAVFTAIAVCVYLANPTSTLPSSKKHWAILIAVSVAAGAIFLAINSHLQPFCQLESELAQKYHENYRHSFKDRLLNRPLVTYYADVVRAVIPRIAVSVIMVVGTAIYLAKRAHQQMMASVKSYGQSLV